jgi:hypothetical protein
MSVPVEAVWFQLLFTSCARYLNKWQHGTILMGYFCRIAVSPETTREDENVKVVIQENNEEID